MISEDEAYEVPPPVFVMTVAPTGVRSDGQERARDARLIGEVLLDKFFGTDVASTLQAESSLELDAVKVHQEVVEDEHAVLTLWDNRIYYPWELSEWVLRLSADCLVLEIELLERRKAQGDG